MKRVWKKDDAVSPVIATILMVAITVVLAAVLYVMVIGFGGTGGSTPAGSWTECKATSNVTGELRFGAFTSDVQPLDIKIFVTVDGAPGGDITFPSNTGSTSLTWNGAPIGDDGTVMKASYFDYNPEGGQINSGDYITLTNLLPGTLYSFEVFHVTSDATVTMTGDGPSFNTP
jgi:flagellin-like protein